MDLIFFHLWPWENYFVSDEIYLFKHFIDIYDKTGLKKKGYIPFLSNITCIRQFKFNIIHFHAIYILLKHLLISVLWKLEKM